MGSPLNEVPDVFVDELNLDWTCSSTNEGLPAALMGSLMRCFPTVTDGNRDTQASVFETSSRFQMFRIVFLSRNYSVNTSDWCLTDCVEYSCDISQ